MTQKTISAADVRILRSGSAKFPVEGTQCNASCAFYAFCANGRDFELCRGFQMLNGENLEHIKRNLDEHAVEYIKNSFSDIQRSLNNGDREFAEVITRDIHRLGEIAYPKPEETPKIHEKSTTHSQMVTAMCTGTADIQGALRGIETPFPEICNKECSHTQCSSWGVASMEGKRCRNQVLTNEQLKTETREITPESDAAKSVKEAMRKFEALKERIVMLEEIQNPPQEVVNNAIEGFPELSRGRNSSFIGKGE